MSTTQAPDGDGVKRTELTHQLPYIDSPFARYSSHWISWQRGDCADAEMDFARCVSSVGVLRAEVDCKKYHDDFMECAYRVKTGANWKQWSDERKATKRKRKEEKLMKEYKQHQEEDTASLSNCLKTDSATNITVVSNLRQEAQRNCTVSIAIPGSILDNAQSPELKTYLVGQIARAAVVFNVDEIVVFDDGIKNSRTNDLIADRKASVRMARILQYLECPQYLRKVFFPQHKDLTYVGLLNPLACPHHMSQLDETEYREGVVLDKPVKEGRGSFVNVGLKSEIQIDKQLQAGLRVTVRMEPPVEGKMRRGVVVSPSHPKTRSGLYWGYSTRHAPSFSHVFTQSPFTGGYDLIIGTSERGTSVDEFTMPTFEHLLVVFGGLSGLESCLEADETLQLSDPSLLFHHYLNTCPGQGSNTIRTEEAILITLSAIRPKIISSK